MARDEIAVRRFVEHMAMTLADWGFPRMPARVLMTLMAADEPFLSATDLCERLDVSPAAVSGAMRYLTQIGLVVREPVAGSRRDHYRLPDDPWYSGTATKGPLMATVAAIAAEGTAALGGEDTPAGRRTAEMRDFFVFIQKEMDGLLERWEAQRSTA